MADTAKKETTKKTSKTSTTKTASKDDKKIKDLEQQNATLQSQNEDLYDKIAKLTALVEKNLTTESGGSKIEFSPEDEITVISMIPHELCLSTGKLGKGTTYIFESMGEEQDITWGDLREIVRNNKKMVEKGRFYILNDDAVTKLRLKNMYKNLLTPDQMINILNQDASRVVELYKMAPEGQQKTIIEMVSQKKLDKKKVDANVLIELSELSGVKLTDIENPMDIPLE